MVTQCEAIIEAFKHLGGYRSINEIEGWVRKRYGDRWKDFGTAMADMVPLELGGNNSSNVPESLRVLKRVSRGVYCLVEDYYLY
jgi:hypothetical protein